MPSRQRIRATYQALERIAAAVAAENNAEYSVGWDGPVHQRYLDWLRDNPDADGEKDRAYRDLQRWDGSKHPMVQKADGQGVLGFYDPDAHLAIDGSGGRVRFAQATMIHWDSWWDVQVEAFNAVQQAHEEKSRIYTQIRCFFIHPKTDTVGRIMAEEFHWQPPIDQGESDVI
jgi:hypothetical protein